MDSEPITEKVELEEIYFTDEEINEALADLEVSSSEN